MRKSESVGAYCWTSTRHVEAVVAGNVTDLAQERARSQDGVKEKTGMPRIWQVPGQLSWRLRGAGRDAQGAIKAERRELRQIGNAIASPPFLPIRPESQTFFLFKIFYWRIPFPFSRVRDFGLGNMAFLWGYWYMELRLGFFYVVVYGSLVWVLSCGFYYGYFGEVRVEV